MSEIQNVLDGINKIEQYQNYYKVDIVLDNEVYQLFIDKEKDFYFLEHKNKNLLKINISLMKASNLEEVNNILFPNKKKIDDDFGLMNYKYEFTKIKIDEELLKKRFQNHKNSFGTISIPVTFILPKEKLIDLVIREIKKVNQDKSHEHTIEPNENPYKLNVNLKNSKGEFKFECWIDSNYYPYYPPKLIYHSPKLSKRFNYCLSKLSILDVKNWNCIVSLNWLFTNLSKGIEKQFDKFNYKEEYGNIEKLIYDLSNLLDERLYQDIDFGLDINKYDLKSKLLEGKYWSKGVGYGHRGLEDWDINKFEENKENINKEITEILKIINSNVKDYKEIDYKFILNYVLDNIKSISIMDINNNKELYNQIIILAHKIYQGIDDNLKSEMNNGIKELRLQLSNFLESVDNIDDPEYYMNLNYKLQQFEDVNTEETKNDNEYIERIKKEQKDIYNYTLPSDHLFGNKVSFNAKSLTRIGGEISTIYKSLPVNWDSSVILKIDKKNIGNFSFLIFGPKDTPYHNGVYEFNGCFTDTYPNKPPKVLLKTTDNSKVRFNPNLYDSGKVCLSLLGTWSGSGGEGWNKTSTLLQVLVSIQSLIFIEDPYFNEPGFERSRGTEKGMINNYLYNDRIRYQNLRVAINNQIENPSKGFEDIIKYHFESKKYEILKTIEGWYKEYLELSKELNQKFTYLNKLSNEIIRYKKLMNI